jgi:NAD-reducing hydrogenase small subunit
MSFLDMDERLLTLAEQVDVVYSPYVDAKTFPENVDIVLVEGAVGSADDREKIHHIRQHSRILVSLGDCAVTGNVSSMRNIFATDEVMNHIYHETVALHAQVPTEGIPPLLERCVPLHEMVEVDVFVPGCPPAADTIYFVLTELLAGRMPDLSTHTRFGA